MGWQWQQQLHDEWDEYDDDDAMKLNSALP